MSKSIWHRYDEVPRHQDIIMTDTGCWAYRADLMSLETELERTRKALNEANEKLRHCVNMTVEELDELKGDLLIAQDALLHFSKDPIANNALKKITTPKQKDK